MEEDNIKWENIGWHPQDANMNFSLDEKTYNSLYEELIDKCNPTIFIDTDRFYAANSIYAILKKMPQEYGFDEDDIPILPTDVIVSIRNRAIRELDIHIQTRKKVAELMMFFDPQTYINMQPYDEERVRQAYDFNKKVQQHCDDILALEDIELSASDFIAKRRDEIKEQKRKDDIKRIEEQELIEQKKSEEQKEVEEANKREERVSLILFGVLVIFCIIAAITSK